MVGAEREADRRPVFGVLLPFFPRTDLTIRMVGDQVSEKKLPPYRVEDAALQSSLHITLTRSMYGPEHATGTAWAAAGGKEQRAPDMVILPNAGLVQHPTWPPTIQGLVASGITTVVTEPMEQAALMVQSQLAGAGVPVSEVGPNPFRMPVFQFNKDVNLPSFDNGFWWAIHPVAGAVSPVAAAAAAQARSRATSDAGPPLEASPTTPPA